MNEAAVTFSWLPPVLFLAGGLLVGSFLAWWTQRKGEGAESETLPPVEVRDLEEKEAALLAQIEELEDTADKYTPERLAAHRRRIELAAAETLRQLEGKRAEAQRRREVEPRPAASVGTGFFARNPALKGFLWGAGAVTALALLFFSVSRSTMPRAPGGSLTGNAPSEAAAGAPESQSEMARQLDARIQANPDDLEARIAKARIDLGQSDWMAAWNETSYVLERDPGNPEAATYQALVRFAMGETQRAIDQLNQALEKAPGFPDAYSILSMVQARSGHLEQAKQTIERAKARLPEQAASFDHIYAELRAEAENAPPGEAAETEATAGAPAAPAPSGPARVSGVIELAPGAAGRAPAGGTLFVLVRPAGASSGPPTAVKRFVSPTFPMHFALSDADSMMGQPFPERLHVEARLDTDGNPLTQTPGDLHAELDDQPLGATDLRLDLKP
jgi:tetratricopeptide (TPR) repeat protein